MFQFSQFPLYRARRRLAIWTPIMIIAFGLEIYRWFVNPIASFWDAPAVALFLMALVIVIDANQVRKSFRR